MEKILVIGFGNPGRLDDGLGPALADRIEQLSLPGVSVDANYQLSVEDADVIKDYDRVIFADASVDAKDPFEFFRIDGESEFHFSSHFLSPQNVLGLAQDLFQAETQGYILAIRGHEFNEFGERLSEKAQKNLDEAVAFLTERIKTQTLDV